MIYFETSTIHRIKSNPHHSIVPKPSPDCHVNDIHISKSITTISWTISTPRESFPYNVSCSCLSESNFTITIVLENVSPVAIYKEVIQSNHKNVLTINPSNNVPTICIIHTPRAVFPCSLMTFGFSHNHTINNKSAIPRCEKSSIKLWSFVATNPRANGPTSTPAKRYPITIGCFNTFKIPVMIITMVKTTLICVSSVWLANVLITSSKELHHIFFIFKS